MDNTLLELARSRRFAYGTLEIVIHADAVISYYPKVDITCNACRSNWYIHFSEIIVWARWGSCPVRACDAKFPEELVAGIRSTYSLAGQDGIKAFFGIA